MNVDRTHSADRIAKIVCKHFHIDPLSLNTRSRKREVVYPRQICMWMMWRATTMPLSVIGKYLGGRDHTTVVHGRNAIENLMEVDSLVKEEIQEILAKL